MPDTAAHAEPATTGGTVRTLARLARVLEHACRELSLPQYRLLAMVASGDERATLLADRLALSKPTVTAVVDGLVERGLLARSEFAGDRRAIRLTLTGRGRTALDTTEAEMAEQFGRLLGCCPDPALVLAGLRQLDAALDQALAERVAKAAR